MDKQYIVVNVSEGIRLASIVQDDDGNNVIFETKDEAHEFIDEYLDDGLVVEYS
jgi:hypothetical protein